MKHTTGPWAILGSSTVKRAPPLSLVVDCQSYKLSR